MFMTLFYVQIAKVYDFTCFVVFFPYSTCIYCANVYNKYKRLHVKVRLTSSTRRNKRNVNLYKNKKRQLPFA